MSNHQDKEQLNKRTTTHVYDQAIVDQLIEDRLKRYNNHTADTAKASGCSPYGALVRVAAATGTAFISAAIEHVQRGYVFMDTHFVQLGSGYSYADFLKPEAERLADIEVIRQEVTESYNEQRRQAYEANKARVVQEAIDKEREAAEAQAKKLKAEQDKAESDALAALVARLEKIAIAALGEFSG